MPIPVFMRCRMVAHKPEANRFRGGIADSGMFKIAEDGIGIVTVTGSLVNRGGWIGASSGLTCYEGITAQLRAAAEDQSVQSIVLDIDSPGGEVGGVLALGQLIRRVREEKPVVAVVNDMAASAGYWLAAQANRDCGERDRRAGQHRCGSGPRRLQRGTSGEGHQADADLCRPTQGRRQSVRAVTR